MSQRPHRIAVIAGDGIGQEVMPQALRALQAAQARFGLNLHITSFDWAHCRYWQQHDIKICIYLPQKNYGKNFTGHCARFCKFKRRKWKKHANICACWLS